METADRQFERLLLAIEDLIAQEELLLQAEDFDAVPALQSRAAPIIERLVALAGSVDVRLRKRVVDLVERRTRSEELLTRQIARVQDELSAMKTSRQRIAKMMPVYRQSLGEAASGKLHVQG